ncbi:MAG TPA: tripartite tricarboxylate transporter TctB family protein [Candidatus Methylomirabilis sp.]|nr:tripartite tricarboxylate transporter TctB family protein [Candidatus Methylomirabilis sp.]
MKRVNQLFGCILLTFFMFMGYTAHTTLPYWTEGSFIGPGSGFFPFWISAILVVLTLYWLIQVTIRPGEEMPADFIPSLREGLLVLLVFADLILFVVILDYVGFPVAMFVFLMIMVVTLGGRRLRDMIYSAMFSAAITAFFVIVFGRWLEVAFPKSEIAILKAIGL